MNPKINFSRIGAGNPLLNALMIAGGTLAFVGLVLFSIVAFLVVASLIAVLAGVVGLRIWWQDRGLGARTSDRGEQPITGRIIEGEYRKVPSRRGGEDREAE